LYGCLKQLYILKRRNRNLKVLLSIGGWSYSANFAVPASNDSGRKTFARSALKLISDCGFDGLDIDWEYPKDDKEASDFVLLLRDTREALETYAATHHRSHGKYQLTVACPAGPDNFRKLHLKEMDQYLDFWNLMAYDYAGSWDSKAGHQANVYPDSSSPSCTPFSTMAAVDYYTKAGVAGNKIVLGCPLYGRAFAETDGLGHPFSGVGEGSWEKGCWDWKALPHEGAQVRNDMILLASNSYHPGTRTMVSYDSAAVAEGKAKWVKEEGLGGVMWWESSADGKEGHGEGSLIARVVGVLGGSNGMRMEKRENELEYPDSKFQNLREGFPNGK